jgi:type I restriction enzyme R subunit
VGNALRHFHSERYELRNFVVMPNHVHVLFHPLGSHLLADILKSWKGFTAREINRRRNEEGVVWQSGYWDRLIRNPRHLEKAAIYLRENPVKAGLLEGEYLLD